MGKDKKEATIPLRVTPEMKEELEKLAATERRSLSDYIRLALERLIEAAKKK